jgi:hypothetical protein
MPLPPRISGSDASVMADVSIFVSTSWRSKPDLAGPIANATSSVCSSISGAHSRSARIPGPARSLAASLQAAPTSGCAQLARSVSLTISPGRPPVSECGTLGLGRGSE